MPNETQPTKEVRPKHLKIAVLFLFFIVAVSIFLFSMLKTVFSPRNTPTLKASKEYVSLRGSIYSKERLTIASSDKLYKASIHTGYIHEDKKDLFAKIFAIYSGENEQDIRSKLNTGGYIVLSYALHGKQAEDIKTLSRKFNELNVFKTKAVNHRYITQGIFVEESGERRLYPYGNSYTPIVGYVRKKETDNFTRSSGLKGIEKFYNEYLTPIANGEMIGKRDIGSNVIFNKDSVLSRYQNGFDVFLNSTMKMQKTLENIVHEAKAEFNAQEVIACIMDSKTGKIIAMATSNRFSPANIKKSDYQSLNASFIENIFEPGSVFKPIVLARLFEAKKATPLEIVRGHNGRFKLGKNVIKDLIKKEWFSVEGALIYSSNIAMAQLAMRLDKEEYYDHLIKMGLGAKTGIDLPYEKSGNIPSIAQFADDTYKATASYGYGVGVSFMQIFKVFGGFNNNGFVVEPRLVDYIMNHDQDKIYTKTNTEQILSYDTARKIKNILIKTVKIGTGKVTRTKGLEVGAKTGTAHVAKDGGYADEYRSSMFGFANDQNSSFTLGVTTFDPKGKHFGSQTSGKVFKKMVDVMVEQGYLIPKLQENNTTLP